MNVVTSNLEGDTVEWLVSLYDEEAPELMNVDVLVQQMRYRFQDSPLSRGQDSLYSAREANGCTMHLRVPQPGSPSERMA